MRRDGREKPRESFDSIAEHFRHSADGNYSAASRALLRSSSNMYERGGREGGGEGIIAFVNHTRVLRVQKRSPLYFALPARFRARTKILPFPVTRRNYVERNSSRSSRLKLNQS